jgi:hypothetical protein
MCRPHAYYPKMNLTQALDRAAVHILHHPVLLSGFSTGLPCSTPVAAVACGKTPAVLGPRFLKIIVGLGAACDVSEVSRSEV